MGKRILIIEDEKMIIDILRFNLSREGYEVLEAYDGKEGLHLAETAEPDLILLDVMLPFLSGFEICRRLRGSGNSVPVIMLTAREEERDKVFGLEIGADDYITKPFSMRELLARVKANIRRRGLDEDRPADAPLTFRGLTIDPRKYEVERDGQPVELTTREFELLLFLARSPGTVFPRDELMEKVWNYGYVGDVRTVDVAVRRLREKLEQDPAEPEYIVTKRGVGYYFRAE